MTTPTGTIQEHDDAAEDPAPLRTAFARGGRLTVVTAALWLALAGPAWLLGGVDGLEGLTYAALLCLAPGWLVFLILALYGTPGTQGPIAALGGTGLRLAFVLVGMLFLQSVRPNLGFWELTVWLLVFYMATLFAETLLVLKRK